MELSNCDLKSLYFLEVTMLNGKIFHHIFILIVTLITHLRLASIGSAYLNEVFTLSAKFCLLSNGKHLFIRTTAECDFPTFQYSFQLCSFSLLSQCEEVTCSASFPPLQDVFSEMCTAFHKHFLSCDVQALHHYNKWHIKFFQPGLAWKSYFKECTLFRGWQNRQQKKYGRCLQRAWTCSFHWKYCWLAFSYFFSKAFSYCIASAGNLVQKFTAVLFLLILGLPNNLPSWKEVSISMRARRIDWSFSITLYALKEFIPAFYSFSVLHSLTKANTALACCLGCVLNLWSFTLVFLDSRGDTFQLVHVYLNCSVVKLDKLSLDQVSHFWQTILLLTSPCVLRVSFAAEQHF